MAGKKYYVLVEFQPIINKYAIEYGAYVYGDCLSERDDKLDHGIKMKHMKILTVETDIQADIDAAVDAFNTKLGL